MLERSDDVGTGGSMPVDPICGAPLMAAGVTAVSLVHLGRTWHFCSQACRGHFARRAERALLEEALRAGRLLAPGARARWGVA